jgi:hypothetical protein
MMIGLAALLVVAGIIICAVSPALQAGEDCDHEDRAKKQWTECGLGVLVPTGKAPTKAPVKTPAPRRTR